MKIVVDLQALQSQGSRFRGIGRYTFELTTALLRMGKHDIHLVLSAAFPDYVQEIRQDFAALIAPDNIHVFSIPTPVTGSLPKHAWRRLAAEHLRENFLLDLHPDVLFVPSLFEGLTDNIVTSVNHPELAARTVVTIYDLIPLVLAEQYLGNPTMRDWYYRKLQALKNAGMGLAISEYSRQEAIGLLGLDPEQVVTTLLAVPQHFRPVQLDSGYVQQLRTQFGINRPFILYNGGAESRKNVDSLIAAYAQLPLEVRMQYQLVIAGKLQPWQYKHLAKLAKQHGLFSSDMPLTGFVTDEELVALYNMAHLFVFPSLYEGFGLPVLEAMTCGTPTLCADNTSLPEVAGWEGALFDGNDVPMLTAKLHEGIFDEGFRQTLREHAQQQVLPFSWDNTAKQVMTALEALHQRRQLEGESAVPVRLQRLALVCGAAVDDASWRHVERLLPSLARFYQVDLITEQPLPQVAWLQANSVLRSHQYLLDNPMAYQRRLYVPSQGQGGMSDRELLYLMQLQPGSLLLTSLYSPNFQASADRLYLTHGYQALQALQEDAIATQYPACKALLDAAWGVITPNLKVLAEAQAWFGKPSTEYWEAITSAPEATAVCGSSVEGKQYYDAIERFHTEHPLVHEQALLEQLKGLQGFNAPTEQDWLGFAKAWGERHQQLLDYMYVERQPTRVERMRDAFVASHMLISPTDNDWLAVSQCIADNRPACLSGKRTLFYDVSAFSRQDQGTGVHRVTRKILSELFISPPEGFRVEPIYADDGVFRYARRMTHDFLGLPAPTLMDELVDFHGGDTYLCIDMELRMPQDMELTFQRIRALGVSVYFLIHDILAVKLPERYFDDFVRRHFRQWLSAVARVADGLICTTLTVQEELAQWLVENPPKRIGMPRLGHCTLGADIRKVVETETLTAEQEALLTRLNGRPAFLMVSTLEPRKGYAQALKAFEYLWARGVEVDLVIVGKKGWNVDELVKSLENHAELGKRLHWLKFVSDTLLGRLYASCQALLIASEGEGFGLPLIEAAQHNLPVVARNLPVFRELAGEHVFYFEGSKPSELAQALQQWLLLKQQGEEPSTEGIQWATWQESAECIKAFLMKQGGQA